MAATKGAMKMNTAKTINEQDKASKEATKQALIQTKDLYTSESVATRVAVQLKSLAVYARPTDEECKDIFFFKSLQLWNTKAYGECKDLGVYINQELGISLADKKSIDIIRNGINYRFAKGKILVHGETPEKTVSEDQQAKDTAVKALKDRISPVMSAVSKMDTVNIDLDRYLETLFQGETIVHLKSIQSMLGAVIKAKAQAIGETVKVKELTQVA